MLTWVPSVKPSVFSNRPWVIQPLLSGHLKASKKATHALGQTRLAGWEGPLCWGRVGTVGLWWTECLHGVGRLKPLCWDHELNLETDFEALKGRENICSLCFRRKCVTQWLSACSSGSQRRLRLSGWFCSEPSKNLAFWSLPVPWAELRKQDQ